MTVRATPSSTHPGTAAAGDGLSPVSLARRAWHGLGWRHWLAAAAAGFAVGCGHSLHFAANLWDAWPQIKVGLSLSIGARWTTAMTLDACALLFGLALLRQLQRQGLLRLRHALAMLLGVALFDALVAQPIAFVLARAVHEALQVPRPAFWADRQGLSLLLGLWSRSVPIVLVVSSLTTLVAWHVDRAVNAARALDRAQLQLADVRRRAMAEELQRAQATVDADFLFDTLNLIEARYDRDPEQVQRLLDALIRRLRAALPAPDAAPCTVGDQVALVRAHLDIEMLRADGRLRARIEVPPALCPQPIAPLLLMPLVVDAVRRGDSVPRPREFVLRAMPGQDRMVFEFDPGLPAGANGVDVDGGGGTPALVELRRRLAQLHGDRARLTLVQHDGPHPCWRLELPMTEGA